MRKILEKNLVIELLFQEKNIKKYVTIIILKKKLIILKIMMNSIKLHINIIIN